MKKTLILILFLAFVGGAFALPPVNTKPNESWWSDVTFANPLWAWLQEANTLIEAGAALGTGSVFYVDSNVTNAGDGSNWQNALATIDGAIDLCTADAGDVIYVAQGHKEVEAVAATSLFTLDVAGVSIIGLGNGGYEATVASGVITNNQRPTLVLDKADATITVSAKHCEVSGLLVISDIDNVAVGLTVAATADGAIIEDCVFRDNAANLDMLVMLSVAAAAQDVQINGNRFITTAAAGGNNAILLAGANTNIEIVGNKAFGKYATGILLGSAAAQVNATISDNTLVNSEAAIAIALHTSSTGICQRNLLGGTTSIAAAFTGSDALWCFENYVTGAVNASGLIDPAVDID